MQIIAASPASSHEEAVSAKNVSKTQNTFTTNSKWSPQGRAIVTVETNNTSESNIFVRDMVREERKLLRYYQQKKKQNYSIKKWSFYQP